MGKSFSTGMSIEKQRTILKEQKRIKHVRAVNDSINREQPIPAKIIFTADHDITEIALRYNQNLSDQALKKAIHHLKKW